MYVIIEEECIVNNIGNVITSNFDKEEEFCSQVLKQWHLDN